MKITKFGWFWVGIWTTVLILDVLISSLNRGTVAQRVAIMLLAFLGYTSVIIFSRESSSIKGRESAT